jgi:hypothetical protein
VWRARVTDSGLLVPHYQFLFQHRELAEYQREGTGESRRAILRFRCDQIPAEVTRGRYARPQVPRALRHCRRCGAAECDDSEHVLLRCRAFRRERRELRRAVRRCMPRCVVEWAGRPREHPDRWLALILDGELNGLPFAEAYGRSVQAIRRFKGLWRSKVYRQRCYAVVRARKELRGEVRATLVAIMRQLEEAQGIRRWAPRQRRR